jgi:hypothetical protein
MRRGSIAAALALRGNDSCARDRSPAVQFA